jgi:iron-chelate-transporting ATPase
VFRLESVDYTIAHQVLLHPLSLAFSTGHVYGLIGHNGSGKSTLLKLLAKQMPPSHGRVTIDDSDIASMSPKRFAQHVAYLPQSLPLATGLTAQELIMMGRYAWNGMFGRVSSEDQAILDNVLALTHTTAFANQQVDTLSGGERQRIWLAMCLAQQSRYLLLDEPLAALDIAHQVDVMQLIRRLAHTLGLGVVVVVHDINLAAQYCDSLIALHGGKVLFQEAPAQLMQQDKLKQIYGMDLALVTHPHTGLQVALL